MMYTSPMEAHTEPLTYDPAIYWLLPYVHAECSASRRVLAEAPDAMRWISAALDRTLARAAQEAAWAHYITADQPHKDDLHTDVRVFRRHAYEQPGFIKIHRYTIPSHIRQFRIHPQGAPIVTLEMHPLMWHGERVRGALHGTDLYLFVPAIIPQGVNNPLP